MSSINILNDKKKEILDYGFYLATFEKPNDRIVIMYKGKIIVVITTDLSKLDFQTEAPLSTYTNYKKIKNITFNVEV